MPAHRFRELLAETTVTHVPSAAANGAFMPCPIMGVLPPAQQTFVQEVYRIAQERTEEQLRSRRTCPSFSMN